MAEIKKQDAYFSLSGEVSIYDNSFVIDKSWKSNEETKKNIVWSVANLNMKCGNNLSIKTVVGGALDGKFDKDQIDDLKIIQFTNGKQETITIPFDSRNDELYTSEVADNKFITIEIEKDENGDLIKKRFLMECDAAKYLKDKLIDKSILDISGTIKPVNSYGVTTFVNKISHIRLSNRTFDNFYTNFKIPFVCTDKVVGEVDENGYVKMNGYMAGYFNDTNPLAAFPMAVYIDTKASTAYKEIINSYFIGSGELYNQVVACGSIVQDGIASNVTIIDYGDEINKALKLGIVTEQDVCGTAIKSNKVENKYVFEKCSTNKKTKAINIKRDLDCSKVAFLDNDIEEIKKEVPKVEKKIEPKVKKDISKAIEDFFDLDDDDIFGGQ